MGLIGLIILAIIGVGIVGGLRSVLGRRTGSVGGSVNLPHPQLKQCPGCGAPITAPVDACPQCGLRISA